MCRAEVICVGDWTHTLDPQQNKSQGSTAGRIGAVVELMTGGVGIEHRKGENI